MYADQPVLPAPYMLRESANMGSMRDFFGLPAIALTLYLTTWCLKIDESFRSGVLVTTTFISAAQPVISRCVGNNSIIGAILQGLFLQFVCYHFGMTRTMHVGNASQTCLTIYAAANKRPDMVAGPAEEPSLVKDDGNDNQNSDGFRSSELSRTSTWAMIGVLISIIVAATSVFADKPPPNNCIVSSRAIDNTHWQATVYEGDLSGKGCSVAAQMTLAEIEIRAYTRGLKEDVCSVSCIKRNRAGYWTAFVSVTPPGGPVDGAYCGKAFSYGNCGKGLARQRNGSV